MAGFIPNATSGAGSSETHIHSVPDSSSRRSELTQADNSTWSSDKAGPSYNYSPVGVDDNEHHSPLPNEKISNYLRPNHPLVNVST